MRLAQRIAISVGGDSIELRPSLRFAMRLEARPGSFAGLIQEISDDSLTAACDVIGDHLDMTDLTRDAVFNVLPDLRSALLSYVTACAGIDPDDDTPANDNRGGKRITFGEHLTGLYRLGTGWLGWTPADTLDATPAEIMEAYMGRLDMLKAIFGGSDDKPDTSDMSLDEKMKTAFAGFNTVKVSRKKAG